MVGFGVVIHDNKKERKKIILLVFQIYFPSSLHVWFIKFNGFVLVKWFHA